MMQMLQETMPCNVSPIESIGANGDAIEAEGFALMAVRHLLNLPISFPGTTGAPKPLTGGTLHKADLQKRVSVI